MTFVLIYRQRMSGPYNLRRFGDSIDDRQKCVDEQTSSLRAHIDRLKGYFTFNDTWKPNQFCYGHA